MSNKELIERLCGIYPVGPIMGNGEPEFGYRQMYSGESPPLINHEAATALSAQEWSSDMDAAPRDGTWIELFQSGGVLDTPSYARAYPKTDKGIWVTEVSGVIVNPTHWRHITLPERTASDILSDPTTFEASK